MRLLFLLTVIPTLLWSQCYYTDESHKEFTAAIKESPSALRLDEGGNVKLELQFPEEFNLKSVSYEYDQSEFSWHQEQKIKETVDQGHKKVLLSLQFDPQLTGEFNLNLPTLHFVSSKDPNNYVSLHPPLKTCSVMPYLDDPQKRLLVKDAVALDLRRPIEMSNINQQNAMDQSKEELERAQLQLRSNSFKKLWKGLVILVLLVLLGYKVIQWLNKKTKLGQVFNREKDPRELALEELRLLQKQMLPQKGFFEEFYIQLTQIVRLYIERRFKINAPEQTTQEFLIEVLDKPLFKVELKSHLEEFLKFADLVKFAKLHPKHADCQQAEDAAFGFIESTDNEEL
ncbi:MAG: hypothetical protein S4CHLAM6_15820 [Chlamydiae bacterium]|nr:hypothetical protein [Chlamydiota bacterium]